MFTLFKTFFLLGWFSFGGPAAHIGYFRQTFVQKLGWLSDEEYAQLVALSQFLPGPGSSQVGFAIGYRKGGMLGAWLAFLGFTLPSIIIMLLLSVLSHQIAGAPLFEAVVHGLKLLAVVVVADATLGMFRSFCQQRLAVVLCVSTAVVLLVFPSLWAQMGVLLVAALVGWIMLQSDSTASSEQAKFKLSALLLFVALLLGMPLLASLHPGVELFSEFYQAGSMVFGGGHVVLPLLQNLVGDQISQDAFLTGYAAAQAVPGPMFTFATYIGYELLPAAPLAGALIATFAVFLPGFLLVIGVIGNWQSLAQKPRVAGALKGVNASVVGLLLAALYTPVFDSAVSSNLDMALIVVGMFMLKQLKLHIAWVIAFFALCGGVLF
ncbi:chromate efflux transporter [Aliagarivorans taiwanensis]|uniref:chromate efflux transporter n=1 Tax=Aliagarivorans taiwanensis TaxID=561966 RepID=UPI00042987BA|nr:chromate efflux transporter [Aliagarivorans taiwanensis]